MPTESRPHVRRKALAVVVAVSSALLTLPGASSAAQQIVTAVQGSGYGYRALNLSLFGGPQPDIGPTPSVTLAPDASNSPRGAGVDSALVMVAETAVLLTSDKIAVETMGSLGPDGSVTSTASLTNVGKAATQPEFTGG